MLQWNSLNSFWKTTIIILHSHYVVICLHFLGLQGRGEIGLCHMSCPALQRYLTLLQSKWHHNSQHYLLPPSCLNPTHELKYKKDDQDYHGHFFFWSHINLGIVKKSFIIYVSMSVWRQLKFYLGIFGTIEEVDNLWTTGCICHTKVLLLSHVALHSHYEISQLFCPHGTMDASPIREATMIGEETMDLQWVQYSLRDTIKNIFN